jgi:hypothetical protein
VRSSEGLTILHSENVLVKNARFVVQPGGRDKVRATRRKTVHAGIRGEVVTDPYEAASLLDKVDRGNNAYYNPYTTDHFVGVNGEKLDTAGVVLLTSENGKPRVFFRESTQ